MQQPEKRYFYILGFPRSRSTWFSQFLSTNVSRCYHEILSGNDLEAFKKYMLYLEAPYVGSADTNPISFSKTKRMPGNMVMIYRDPKESLKSLRQCFDRHEAFTIDEWEQYTANMISMYDICLDWYKEFEPNLLYVDFPEMEDDQTIMKIFKHCVPAFDPDWSYIRIMQNLRITIKSRKGLRNGIESSCKNIDKDIQTFKADHLGNYDPDYFREEFFKGMELAHHKEKEDEPSRLVEVSGGGFMGRRDN